MGVVVVAIVVLVVVLAKSSPKVRGREEKWYKV
jgi:hypothetical protein